MIPAEREEPTQDLWSEYALALHDADPNHEDGLLGASVGQDAKYAVSERVRLAAQACLNAGASADDWPPTW